MDLFGCLPLYYKFREQSPPIHMVFANLTFVDRKTLRNACNQKHAEQVHPWIFKVLPDDGDMRHEDTTTYFPERRLAVYLGRPIYAIVPYDTNTVSHKNDPRIEEFASFFSSLIQQEAITKIYYIDGGCDSLLKGCEENLATPTEDMFTIKVIETAIAQCSRVEKKSHRKKGGFLKGKRPPSIKRFLVILGADLDIAHGVKLEDLEIRFRSLAPLWVEHLSLDKAFATKYCEAVLKCNPDHSIVHSLVVAAIRGLRGYVVPPWLRCRLRKTQVPLTDRLTQMFCYDVDQVLQENVYWKGISLQFTCAELDAYICDQHERAYLKQFIQTLLTNPDKIMQLCWEYLGWG